MPETVDMSGREALVKPSAASAALKYTGGELEFMPDGFDASLMEITGNRATAVGGYTATVMLRDTENTRGRTARSIRWSLRGR